MRPDDDDAMLESLGALADPPLPDLLDRRVRTRALEELERSGRRTGVYQRVVEPVLSVAVAAAHLIWALDSVMSLYR